MQAVNTQVINTKPTEAQMNQQLQMQADSIHWNQQQNALQAAWSRQNTTQQQLVAHEHYMVDELTTPIVALLMAIVIGLVVAYCFRQAYAAAITKNRDDNASDVRRAQEILDKHEASA